MFFYKSEKIENFYLSISILYSISIYTSISVTYNEGILSSLFFLLDKLSLRQPSSVSPM